MIEIVTVSAVKAETERKLSPRSASRRQTEKISEQLVKIFPAISVSAKSLHKRNVSCDPKDFKSKI